MHSLVEEKNITRKKVVHKNIDQGLKRSEDLKHNGNI